MLKASAVIELKRSLSSGGRSTYRAWKLWIEPERLRLRRSVRLWLREVPSAGVVLEIGAGSGFLRPVVSAEVPNACYVGGEIAPTDNTDVVLDAISLPIACGSVDVVLAVEILEHVAEPRLLVAEAARVLRPGGRLILTVPFMFGVHDFVDYHRFTPLGFEQLVQDFGFVISETRLRGGTFVAATGLIRALILNALVGRPKDWRARGKLKQIRWLISTVVLTPWVVITLLSFVLDAVFDRRSAGPPGYFFLCVRSGDEQLDRYEPDRSNLGVNSGVAAPEPRSDA